MIHLAKGQLGERPVERRLQPRTHPAKELPALVQLARLPHERIHQRKTRLAMHLLAKRHQQKANLAKGLLD